MKTAFFLFGLVALAGCASTSPSKPAAAMHGVDLGSTPRMVSKGGVFDDIPLKPMTATQSAARMN